MSVYGPRILGADETTEVFGCLSTSGADGGNDVGDAGVGGSGSHAGGCGCDSRPGSSGVLGGGLVAIAIAFSARRRRASLNE